MDKKLTMKTFVTWQLESGPLTVPDLVTRATASGYTGERLRSIVWSTLQKLAKDGVVRPGRLAVGSGTCISKKGRGRDGEFVSKFRRRLWHLNT